MADNLKRAKDAKNNEFYTLKADISKELVHYWDQINGKVVYCNCDNPADSNFWKYLRDNFLAIGLKELWSTYYIPGGHCYFTRFDGKMNVEVRLEGDGDFRSPECVELLRRCDVIITNGPFTLNRELMLLAIRHNKKFLLLGNQNMITSREVFENLMLGNFKLGYTSGMFKFLVPNDYDLGQISVDEKGNRYAHLGNIAWFTNLEVRKQNPILELTQWYHPSIHQKFNNSNIINIDKVSDIPHDYEGIMGVPISYLTKHNPEQFEIVGLINSEKWVGIRCYAIIGQRRIYNRILIKKRINNNQ